MAKPAKPTKTFVVDPAEGSCVPFLRGILTSSLQDAGLGFKAAYKLASQIRRDLAEREEVSTRELREIVAAHLEQRYGPRVRTRYMDPKGLPGPILVRSFTGQVTALASEVLARSLEPCGLSMEESATVASRIQRRLIGEGQRVVDSNQLSRITYEFLLGQHGVDVARRYLVWVEYRRSGRPLIILIGGTNGSGKSTVAAELAHRLDIVRIQSTDMLREVMRKMVSQKLMPVLHTSSFNAGEHLPRGQNMEPESDALIVDGFLAQAGHLSVASEAVIKRAMSERVSLILEGIHVNPAMQVGIARSGDAIVVPIMLAALRPEQLRAQLRGRSVGKPDRRAQRYLNNFDAIWALQTHLLSEADQFHVPLIANSKMDKTIAQVLDTVTTRLAQEFPGDPQSVLEPVSWRRNGGNTKKVLFFILDGLADEPQPELGNLTPLEAANTPNLDRLASAGEAFAMLPYVPGSESVSTHTGTGLLFGVPGELVAPLGRGPVEAAGVGMQMNPGDVILRCNFATLEPKGEELLIRDRRAGRIDDRTDYLARALNGITLDNGVVARFIPATQHRGVLRLRGEGLSAAVSDVDPGDSYHPGEPVRPARPEDESPAAQRTANAINEYVRKAHAVLSGHVLNEERRAAGLLPANGIICRGAGMATTLNSLLVDSGLQVAVVTAEDTVVGLASLLGFDVVTDERFTALPDTDIEFKLLRGLKALDDHDVVIIHLKGADIAAHDRNPLLKRDFIERFDQALSRVVDEPGLIIALASDHGTDSATGAHTPLPVPSLLVASGSDAKQTTKFGDRQVAGNERSVEWLLRRVVEYTQNGP